MASPIHSFWMIRWLLEIWNSKGDGERLFHAARRFLFVWEFHSEGGGIYRCLGEFWLIFAMKLCKRHG